MHLHHIRSVYQLLQLSHTQSVELTELLLGKFSGLLGSFILEGGRDGVREGERGREGWGEREGGRDGARGREGGMGREGGRKRWGEREGRREGGMEGVRGRKGEKEEKRGREREQVFNGYQSIVQLYQ